MGNRTLCIPRDGRPRRGLVVVSKTVARTPLRFRIWRFVRLMRPEIGRLRTERLPQLRAQGWTDEEIARGWRKGSAAERL
jgi:hypothetical protein